MNKSDINTPSAGDISGGVILPVDCLADVPLVADAWAGSVYASQRGERFDMDRLPDASNCDDLNVELCWQHPLYLEFRYSFKQWPKYRRWVSR